MTKFDVAATRCAPFAANMQQEGLFPMMQGQEHEE